MTQEIIPASDINPASLTDMNMAPEVKGSIIKADEIMGAAPVLKAESQPVKNEDSIAMSAAYDLMDVFGGTAQMINTGIMQGVNVFHPDMEKNTLYQLGKGLYQEYKNGTIGEDVMNTVKAIAMPTLERASDVSGKIVEGKPIEAIETVARKPFSYTMDVMSLGKPMGKAAEIAADAPKGTASFITGVPFKRITQRIAKSESVSAAREPIAIVEDIPNAFKTLSDKIYATSKEARATLSTDPMQGYSKADFLEMLDDTKTAIGEPTSDAAVSAISTLDRYSARIGKKYKEGFISQADMKKEIQQLDQDINYDPTRRADPTNSAIRNLRGAVDFALKTDNPAYKSAMRPVDRLMRLKEKAMDSLSIKEEGKDFVASKSTENKVAKLHTGTLKNIELDTLKQFGEETGLDVVGESENYAIKQAFETPRIAGSRKVNVGGAIGAGAGAMIGHAVGSSTGGAAIGAVLGGLADAYGGKALGAIIDTVPGTLKTLGKGSDITVGFIKSLGVPEASPAILYKGWQNEKKDHPWMDDEQALRATADELRKDPNFYNKD